MPGSLSSCPQFLVSGLNLSFAPFYFGTVPRAASVICITRLCDESGQGARIGAGAYRFYFPGEVGRVRVNEGWEGFRFRPARRERRVPLCDQSGTHPSQKAREGWGTHCMVVLAEGWATRLSGFSKSSGKWPSCDIKARHRGPSLETGRLRPAYPGCHSALANGRRALSRRGLDVRLWKRAEFHPGTQLYAVVPEGPVGVCHSPDTLGSVQTR